MEKLNRDLQNEVLNLTLQHCAKRGISVRQFMIELGYPSRQAWNALLYKPNPSYGKLNLFIKLLNYFNYDNKTENRL